MNNVFTILSRAAKSWPDFPALIDGQGILTFRELEQEARKLSLRLSTHGLKAQSGLALIADNSREFVIGLFAGLHNHAVVMPLSPTLRLSEIKQRIQEYRPEFVLAQAKYQSITDSLGLTILDQISSFEFLKQSVENCSAEFIPELDSVAFVRHTSGTTGKSKGVAISHRAALQRIEAAQNALQIQAGEKIAWMLPMAFHFIVSILLYIRSGACTVICEESDAQNILDVLLKYQCQILYASPTIFRNLVANSRDESLAFLRLAISTSAKLEPDIAQAFLSKFKLPISPIYGMIEIGLPIGNLPPHKYSQDSTGCALPGYEVRVLGEDFTPLPDGCLGSLAVQGPGMFEAYLLPYRSRDSLLKNNWFLTGDLAIRRSDGSIHIRGRKQSALRFNQQILFSEELEAALCRDSSILSARVSMVTPPANSRSAQRLQAEIVPQQRDAAGLEYSKNQCQRILEPLGVPFELKIVDQIALTASGKVRRFSAELEAPLE